MLSIGPLFGLGMYPCLGHGSTLCRVHETIHQALKICKKKARRKAPGTRQISFAFSARVQEDHPDQKTCPIQWWVKEPERLPWSCLRVYDDR